MARGVGGEGDYLREVIILKITIKEGRLFEGGDYSKWSDYLREVINRGTAIIRGNTEMPIMYISPKKLNIGE